MKNLILVMSILLVFLLALINTSCKRDKEKQIEPLLPPKVVGTDSVEVILTGNKPEFRTRVYIIDEETSVQIVSISRDKINIKKGAILRGGEGMRVEATEIKVGEILAAGVTSKTPNGLNRRITAVAENKLGTELEIETRDASFEDIFKNASFTLKHSFETSVDLTHKFGAGVISTNGNAAVELGFEMPIEVEDYKLKKIEAKAVVDLKAKLSISASTNASTPLLEYPIFSRKFLVVAIVPVGFIPFPIVLTPKLDIILTGSAGIEGTVTFNAFDSESKWELGAGYEEGRGTYPIAVDESRNEPFTIQGELNGYVESGLKAGISISFYDLDYVNVGDEIKFSARVDGQCKSDGNGKAAVNASGGVESSAFVKFDLFGFEKSETATAGVKFTSDTWEIPFALCGAEEPEEEIPNQTDFADEASSVTDPHLTTIDKSRFSFMAVGEFIAAKSTVDDFEIQVRQQEVKSKSSNGTVSWNTGLAIKTGNGNVCIYPDAIYVNGKSIGTSFRSHKLTGTGEIIKEGSKIKINNSKGDIIRVDLFETSLDYYFLPNISRRAKLTGILGNYDGNAPNDVQVRGGEVVIPSYVTLYPKYANSWRIKAAESLFVYDAGKTTETYTDLNFPRNQVNLSANQRASARTVCEKAGVTDPVLLENCVIDVGSTADETLATRIYDNQVKTQALTKFSIGDFSSSDVKLAYYGASAVGREVVLDTRQEHFSRVMMNQGVHIRNGFESEFIFSTNELAPLSVFYLALWPTSDQYRSDVQTRAGFGFKLDQQNGVVFFLITSIGTLQEKAVPNFVDGKMHKVRIIEKKQPDGMFKIELFLDQADTPELSLESDESICKRINARDDVGFIEFQISQTNNSSPSSIRLYNWSFQSL